ncbi:MAG TPA: NAD(P)H-binding protein [Solirubrobacteraceae bacterium]|nr:NAD(P)H-binding protein [Solirubrobacteraceae bacterium]
MILVTGAAGTVGTLLVNALRAKGVAVRALVRDGDALPTGWDGVERMVADLGDPESLRPAVDGVDAIYLLVPADPPMADYERNVIEAAARSAARPRVTLHGALGIADPSGVRFLEAHAAALGTLKASGLRWTVLAPNGFFQNFLRMRASLEAGSLSLPAGAAPVSYIDAADVAASAAAVLTTGGHDEAVYTLTGPAALTHQAIAEQLSATVGRPVRYRALDPRQGHDALMAAGMDEWHAAGMVELYDLYASGAGAEVSTDVERLIGRPPRSLASFLPDNAHHLA